MDYILNIETATTNCSVSISRNGELLALKEDNSLDYSHAESLHVFIEDIFRLSGLERTQLNAVAVSKGPGSYTGLRIGVSAAKGLCFALDIPLISVDTLESLAHQVETNDGVIIPMLDARRMEVYSAVYGSDYKKIAATEAKILDNSSFKSYLDSGKVYFLGNGMDKFQSLIEHSNAIFINDKLPSAKQMVNLAYQKFVRNDFENLAYFEPYYLKEFIGSRKA